MAKYDQIKSNKKKIDNALKQEINNIYTLRDEAVRVANVASNAGEMLDEISKEFAKETKLNKTDITLLFVAVGLQCIRQFVFSNEQGRFQDTRGEDGKIIKSSSEKGDEFMESTIGKVIPKTWEQILFQSVPYDALKRGDGLTESTGLSGANHRYRTLGHDPILGLFFGTMNILSNSCTTYSFKTYLVENNTLTMEYPGEPGGIFSAIKVASVQAQKDYLLAAALGRQLIHLGSDFFTKQGLPTPGIMLVNNDLAAKMIKNNLDMYSVAKGATLSALINSLIGCLHSFFYDEVRDGDRELYNVRTRRILSYSNIIASSSNVIYVALTKDVGKLDLGGLLVTITRVISDYGYIQKIKEEFLVNHWNDIILGDEEFYDF